MNVDLLIFFLIFSNVVVTVISRDGNRSAA